MADSQDTQNANSTHTTKSITVTPDMIEGNYELKVDLSKSVPKLKANEYQCAACGGVFGKGWTDADAQAEYEANFPTLSNTPYDVVCDDCYLQLTAWKSPQEAEAEVTDLVQNSRKPAKTHTKSAKDKS